MKMQVIFICKSLNWKVTATKVKDCKMQQIEYLNKNPIMVWKTS